MRYNKIDNMKALLIFSVVLGHLCEIVDFNGSHFMYMYIYVFHMPAFALCSGLFASFHPKKIFKNLLFPYIIFQTLYILFSHFILNLLIFIGSCAGSTGGGLKVSRVLILIKTGLNEVKQSISPRRVLTITEDSRRIPDNIIRSLFVCVVEVRVDPGSFRLGLH